MKIVFSKKADNDLASIRGYISDVLKNSPAAQRITNKILKSCYTLSEFPYIGVSLQEKISKSTDYLCLFCEKYIIFYLIKSDTVYISRILDGRTSYLQILFS